MENPRGVAESIIANVEKVIVGKHGVVELTVIALLCEGHALIEDVPGLGKTMLARSLARSIGCTFKRIQFTPDLLPSDVTGVSIYNQKDNIFEFRPGPLLANIVLADEINRATPKTQSALLEGMEEKQVTVDGATHTIPQPFMVLATQNPIEYEGTFPLPEAQIDRFMVRVHLGYPTVQEEIDILERQQQSHPLDQLGQVITLEELQYLQEEVKKIYVDPLIKQYVVNIVDATRRHDSVYLGASPRGSLALFRASRAWALLRGRDHVLPDDIKAMADATLSHRLIIQPSARMKDITQAQVTAEVLNSLPVPGARARAAIH